MRTRQFQNGHAVWMAAADGSGGPVVPGRDVDGAKQRVLRTFVEIAPTYGTGLTEFWEVFGRDLVTAAGVQPGQRVLDLACGRGACLRAAHEAVGADGFVLGVDLAPAMVELLAGELRSEGTRNAEVRVGDAEHLDLPDASVDVVTCGFGVFFFPAPVVALGECRRVLRAGGRFAASTFADGMLDYDWLPAVIAQMGLTEALRSRRGSGSLLRSSALAQALAAAGFQEATTTTSRRRFVFPDLDAYLLWVRSHAFGAVVAQLSARDRRRFERECARHLQGHQAVDGYELIKSVDLTTARRL
jgi:ubiquinone/menaquinone biosynthesis C-methylase UbiE